MLRDASFSLSRLSKRTFNSFDIFLLAFCVLVVNVIINLFSHYVLGLGYPYDTFLFIPEDRFADFFKIMDALHVVEVWGGENQYDGMFNAYALPFSSVYLLFFSKLILLLKNKYLVLILYYVFLISTQFYLSRKMGNSYPVIILSIISYPVIVTLDRGHFAFAVFIILFYALVNEKLILSSLGISLATSLKIIPAIFIVAAILRKPFSWARVLIGIALLALFIAFINYISVIIIENQLKVGPFDEAEFLKMMSYYYKDDLIQMRGLAYGSSLYMPTLYLARIIGFFEFFFTYIKPLMLPVIILTLVVIRVLMVNKFPSPFSTLFHLCYVPLEWLIIYKLSFYPLVTLILVGISGYNLYLIAKSSPSIHFNELVAIIEKYLTFEKLVAFTCFCFILFAPVSGDYYLLLLLLPLLLFPDAKYSFGYYLAYGLVLGAKNFIFIEGTNVSWQVFINPLLILIMLLGEFDIIRTVKRQSHAENAILARASL